MEDPNLADDPTYRAGVLMGRQQSITDVMTLLLDDKALSDQQRLEAVIAWCVQTQDESRLELELVLIALHEDDA